MKTFVDANIQITPATATNPVGTNHTLHGHINVNAGDGAGFVNAPAGTICTVNITAGPGTPATQNCTTVGATGTCDVTITSATTGTSTIQATTTVSVGGVSLTRTTGDAHAGDGAERARRTGWTRTSRSRRRRRTNPVGTKHVLTITVNASNGTLCRRHGDGVDRERPGQLRRLADLQLRGWRRDGELHGDDHVDAAGHDGGVGDVEHLGRRPDDHADDEHGREHGGGWEWERAEELDVAALRAG